MRFRLAVMQAFRGLTMCGTGRLGFREYTCAEHGAELIPNSCRRRDCPRCVGARSWRWCEMVEARLLDCPHFHVVFTLPGVLHPYWRHNRKAMADLLFEAAARSLGQLLADPRYMGGIPAMLGVLHTHGSALTLHPHVHFVLSSVGLRRPGTLVWVTRPETLLPYGVLRRKFQLEFLHRLKRLADEPGFCPPTDTTALQLHKIIDGLFKLRHRKWNVMVFLRKDVRPVIRYLSATVYGGPIRNTRIVAVTPEQVTFLYRDWRDQEESISGTLPPMKERRVHLNEFVQMWSEHISEPGMKTVRYWGLLSPGYTILLDLARAALGQSPAPEEHSSSEPVPEPAVRCFKCAAVMTVRELPRSELQFSPEASAIIRARAPPWFPWAAAS